MEVTIEILSQLPVNSLSRFKCVCKYWKNLIESPDFFKLHLNRSLKINSYNCSLILTINRTVIINRTPNIVSSLYRAYLDHNNINLNINKLVLPPSFQPSHPTPTEWHRCGVSSRGNVEYGRIEVAGSCNGLVLILNGLRHIAVCNPAIKQEHATFKILPCITYLGYGSFGYNPETYLQDYYWLNHENQPYQNYACRFYSFRVFGFGYDCYNHCYKIVYLTPKRALVYSTMKDSSSWRKINLPDFEQGLNHSSRFLPLENQERVVYIQAYNHGVATNNHLHWHITKYDPQIIEYSEEMIISFDLQKEEWGEVPMPDRLDQGYFLQGYKSKSYILELGVLNGCLCLLISRGISHPHLELWIMKAYGVKESWTKLCYVPNGSGIPLVYLPERDELLLPGDYHALGWYKLKGKRIRKLEFHGSGFTGEHFYSINVNMCIESLVHPFTSIEEGRDETEEIYQEAE